MHTSGICGRVRGKSSCRRSSISSGVSLLDHSLTTSLLSSSYRRPWAIWTVFKPTHLQLKEVRKIQCKRLLEEASSFKRERLKEASPKKQFRDPMRKTRLFKDIYHNREKEAWLVHISGNAAILKADMSLFGKMIVIAQSRQLNMTAIFVHPLGPIPWALARPEGFPKK